MLRIGIFYNIVEQLDRGFESDKIADNEIIQTVDLVFNALSKDHEVILLRLSKKTISLITESYFDIVFNLCEGFEGNVEAEAYIPALLELLHIPYTGSNSFTLALCLDKVRTKQILKAYDILTPRFQLFSNNNEKVNDDLSFPLIVKPVHEDASIGISINSVVKNNEELKSQIHFVLDNYHQPALVEEYIDGREINAAVIGNGNDLEILPLSEIIFDIDPYIPRIMDYKSKWVEDSYMFQRTKGISPAEIDDFLSEKIQDIAKRAYQATGCRDYARVDFRIKNEEIFVLEVNPNPGINSDSGFFRCAITSGMNYKQFIKKILSVAVKRYQIRIDKTQMESQKENPVHSSENLDFYYVRLKNIPLLQEWFNNPAIAQFMSDPDTKSEKDPLIASYILKSNPKDYTIPKDGIYFIVTDRISQKQMGYCAIYDITWWNSTAEISYLIGDENFLKKGFSKEIISGLLYFAEKELKLCRLEASVTQKNIASWISLEKTGFERVGYRTCTHRLHGESYDEYIYEYVFE
ncbi:GNAT family N-acetyltransferase [Promethearchaeum syntrophicum]|uniref:GNAT family N-acetyltransferase n=1 Tax=Promethearchaeum syntrophicum TaxID=2594042 RepID=A0A5B9DBL0_9ARCH|nr:GNAT family N-acetyltransferase [Candidatus Prometheoarchaeum syntrophicum]QEE16411.1 D-alanine--D-alanine ligase [Candidatus Prometheoarchaeum syntrophicum]